MNRFFREKFSYSFFKDGYNRIDRLTHDFLLDLIGIFLAATFIVDLRSSRLRNGVALALADRKSVV